MIPKHPLVSIVIPVLNGARNIKRTIHSVVCQTYLYKELIIIDGGSTDGTVDILRSSNAEPELRIVENGNTIRSAAAK